MMTGCLARSIDIPCERSSFQALTALRQPLTASTRRIVLEKYLSNSFSRLCPTDSLFVGRSVINTHPSSRFLKSKESPPKVLKLKTSFESTRPSIRSQKRQKFPEPGCQNPYFIGSSPHVHHRGPFAHHKRLSKDQSAIQRRRDPNIFDICSINQTGCPSFL